MDEQRLIGGSDEVLDQLERMVRRDRNHPSIILWSLGNEEPLESSEVGGRMAATMQRAIKRLDPTRPTTFAGNNGSDYDGINAVVDVRGWNYTRMGSTDEYHKDHPKQPIVGSEEASTIGTRGIYEVDRERGYLTAYDIHQPGWGKLAEEWWTYAVARPFFAGAFVWTGFDYRGEPTPYGWPCISSHFGIIDTCGFPKDNFYYYQAWWTDKPVVHLLPHWNWAGKEGKEIDVWCHSNCDKVELLLNGKSLGAKEMKRNSHLEWKVPYEPGTLEARGFTGGKLVATDKRETAGPPAKLLLTPDRTKIDADGDDVSMVAVSVLDAQGRPMPVADNLIRFEVSPNARIIGVGNGDPSSHEADKYFADTLMRNVGGWRMKLVNGTTNRPETKPEFDDSAWDEVSVTAHPDGPLQPNQAAVYRTTIDIAEGEHWRTLSIGRIDDLGWVYLNGKKLGETTDWQRGYSFDVSSALHPGKNVLAVVVQNQAGPGGLTMGVSLSAETTPQWKRRAFNGLCMVIVQSSRKAGHISLTAASAGLETATATIEAGACKPRPSVP
jgi:beta-galactosidase